MCRWIFYYGEEVCIAKLIFGATHALAHMSEVGLWGWDGMGWDG